MSELHVKDVFPLSNGIMSRISLLGGYEFNADTDLKLIATCGRRCVSPVVDILYSEDSDAMLDRVASLLTQEYMDSWDKLKEYLTLEYNPLSASSYHEEETQDNSGTNTDTVNDVTQQDVSTADSLPENYLSDGKTTQDTKTSATSTTKLTRTLDRTSNGTSYKSSDLLQGEINLRIMNRFSDRVLNDVKNYISMPIY